MWQRKHLAVAPASGPGGGRPGRGRARDGGGVGVHPGQPPVQPAHAGPSGKLPQDGHPAVRARRRRHGVRSFSTPEGRFSRGPRFRRGAHRLARIADQHVELARCGGGVFGRAGPPAGAGRRPTGRSSKTWRDAGRAGTGRPRPARLEGAADEQDPGILRTPAACGAPSRRRAGPPLELDLHLRSNPRLSSTCT